jgi:hypothetical protein
MKVPLLIILSFLLCTESFAQKTITEYKALADIAIKQSFSRLSFKKVKCYTYIARDRNNGKIYNDYCKKNDSLKINIEFISTFYDLYSKELDYTFEFTMSVDSSMKIYFTGDGGYSNIPPCVKKNRLCNYIKQKEAIAIARKDSIQYSDDLLVRMEKPQLSDQFYWVVMSGQKEKFVMDKDSIVLKKGWYPDPSRSKNTRYVNAKTGKLLSFEEYQRLNPDD